MSIVLTQEEADSLLALEKHFMRPDEFIYPSLGGAMRIELFSVDRREEFCLDITRSRVQLEKNTFQNRGRQTVVLARLDFGGPMHRNPDDTEIPCPHLHIYREGFGDKWAIPLPDRFVGIDKPTILLSEFMNYCQIITKPRVHEDLFT